MKNFKKGDRVRVKDTPNPEWMPKMPPLPDTIFNVDDTQNGKLILSVKGSNAVFICDAKHFELVESPDPKTAFLTELQALMKRYNATIDVDGDECALWLTIDIDGHAIEYTVYDYFTDKKKQTALTPDNIFNYEKE